MQIRNQKESENESALKKEHLELACLRSIPRISCAVLKRDKFLKQEKS